MTKVLRIYKGGADTIGDWDISDKIGTKAIESIPDPIGATDKREITSIPSPFARMDLIKRAFKIVAEGSLEGQTAYHKLVSDCLDVGQLFFNIEKFRDKIEIIVWDPKADLEQLSGSDYEEHRRLGKTYKTFIEQDSDEYNFDKMDCIYLLNYVDPSAPNVMNIIGATSPATIFFSSANELNYVGEKIKFGADTPFDDEYMPLYKRDFEYIKYWWSLKNSRPDFARFFPEVDLYLDRCYKELSSIRKNDLKVATDSHYYKNNYDEISVTADSQQYVTILGEKLRGKSSVLNFASGFKIKMSDKLCKPGMRAPLALPVEMYTEPTLYVISKWNKNTHVPYFDVCPINERTLPDDGSKYPYVTVGDFLEDTIVKIPYKFNGDGFFNGNDGATNAKDSYILPIKKTFFDYFTVKELTGKVNGKHCVEIDRLNGEAVKVVLRIPIQENGYIQYEKIYYKDGKVDRAANKGVIVVREFTIGLYPAIKYTDGVKPYYRVSLLDRDSVSGQDSAYALAFYDYSNNPVAPEDVVCRNRTAGNTRFDKYLIDSMTYALESEYQYMSISNEDDPMIHGVVIPNFASKAGNHKFRFAIDFGTTNTHIEYSVDGSDPTKAFDITENDSQIQKLHVVEDEYDIKGVFNSDFIPDTIGGDSLYGYPMRTVISESNNTNWSKAVLSMAHVNIPYAYEKSLALPYNILHTNLKWSTSKEDKQRAAKYIESLLLLLRNKVLLNNGDLRKTEVVWFYPASMTQNRFNKFKDEWVKSFVELFGAPAEHIIAIPESVAPYYYHRNKNGAASTVVSIDIGGGTTDVLFVDKGKLRCQTSFRFAANSVFGDGYSYDAGSNGLVDRYKEPIMSQLETNGLRPLKEVLQSVLDKSVSTEIIAFLFSLASNKDILNKRVEIDFGKMLADDNRGKYAVILFYVAIMYHIATLMKAKGFDMPRHITFSGNGSKALNILSTNDATLAGLTKLIFERIYGVPYPNDGLDIIRPADSKESTCKGGIIHPFDSQDYSEIKKTVLVGSDGTSFADDRMTYSDISSDMLDGVVHTVEDFIEFVFDLDSRFSFYDNFDVDRSIMEKVKKLCYRDIRTYLDNGLSVKKSEIVQDGADANLEETLFFYPLVGMLNAVVRNIYRL